MSKTSNNLEKLISDGCIEYYEYSDFKNIKPMGRGSSGNVSCATWKDTTRIFALKSFNNDKQTHKEIVKELMLHRKVDIHENILQFYGITSVEIDAKQMKKYSLVLEYADSDTLSTYLSNHFNELNWSDKLRVRLAFQLASAIESIHCCGIIHRDLHAKNILIHQKNIKLTDFGLSKKIAEESSGAKKVFVVIPYIDPKSLMDQQYKLDKKSDIYSIGVLMWQISSGHQPFKNKGFDYDVQLSIAILNGLREEIIDETPFEYSNLYKECWKYELNNRPNIQEVVLTLKAIISSENRTANKYYSKEIAKNLSCKEAISDVIMDINKDYFVNLRDDETWFQKIIRRTRELLKAALNVTPGGTVLNNNSILSMITQIRQGLCFKYPVASYYIDWRIMLIIQHSIFNWSEGSEKVISKKYGEMILMEYFWSHLEREWANTDDKYTLVSQTDFDEILNKVGKTLKNTGGFHK
ncbi:hypothetical protein RclHR1_00400031 [Rhizophagus clarus]|uniref:Protein kinase domain-containing protein n=1 Tax=Rhizophagus clarus TaxID=94130 RepID=A0A2Z6S8T8_9GLOM|nr:hypothetical protein RclHR1_00400031 [Rhizophagus clarus]